MRGKLVSTAKVIQETETKVVIKNPKLLKNVAKGHIQGAYQDEIQAMSENRSFIRVSTRNLEEQEVGH